MVASSSKAAEAAPRAPLHPAVAQVVAVVQAIGFPAAFAAALLYFVIVTAPEAGDRIAASVRDAAQTQREDIARIHELQRQTLDAILRLVERLPR